MYTSVFRIHPNLHFPPATIDKRESETIYVFPAMKGLKIGSLYCYPPKQCIIGVQLTQNYQQHLHQGFYSPHKKMSPIDVKQSPERSCCFKKEETHESLQTLIRKGNKKHNEL